MARSKFMTIQHCVNPAILRSHKVRFVQDALTYSIVGQVLFFSARGGHWAVDDREHHFVGVYDPDHGALIALLSLAIVQSIASVDLPEDADEIVMTENREMTEEWRAAMGATPHDPLAKA